MREILFRGKATWDGRWLYGEFVNNPDPRIVMHSQFGNKESIVQLPIDPATMGQYIGLTDKHGKRIFEGDIIKGRRTKAYAVEYSQNIAGFIARGTGVLSVPCMNPGTMKDYEVIGNIHDNPELLE